MKELKAEDRKRETDTRSGENDGLGDKNCSLHLKGNIVIISFADVDAAYNFTSLNF